MAKSCNARLCNLRNMSFYKKRYYYTTQHVFQMPRRISFRFSTRTRTWLCACWSSQKLQRCSYSNTNSKDRVKIISFLTLESSDLDWSTKACGSNCQNCVSCPRHIWILSKDRFLMTIQEIKLLKVAAKQISRSIITVSESLSKNFTVKFTSFLIKIYAEFYVIRHFLTFKQFYWSWFEFMIFSLDNSILVNQLKTYLHHKLRRNFVRKSLQYLFSIQ